MPSYSYSIDYTRLNRLVYLASVLSVKFTNSRYFKNIKDFHSRTESLSSKYKDLMASIMEDKSEADRLESIVTVSGIDGLEKELRESKHGFHTISYASNLKDIHLSSRKISPALQDYLTKYAELLETIKYMLADIYGDHLDSRDSFNRFISRKTTTCKNAFDFTYFMNFNSFLWNEQKHNSEITVTHFTRGQEKAEPHLRVYSGTFNRQSVEDFALSSLDKLVELLEFLGTKVS